MLLSLSKESPMTNRPSIFLWRCFYYVDWLDPCNVAVLFLVWNVNHTLLFPAPEPCICYIVAFQGQEGNNSSEQRWESGLPHHMYCCSFSFQGWKLAWQGLKTGLLVSCLCPQGTFRFQISPQSKVCTCWEGCLVALIYWDGCGCPVCDSASAGYCSR